MLCNHLQKIKNYRTLEDGVVIAVAAALILLSLHLNDIPLPRVLLSRCIAPDCRWVFKVLALSTACCCILASCNLRAMYKGRLLHFWNYIPNLSENVHEVGMLFLPPGHRPEAPLSPRSTNI